MHKYETRPTPLGLDEGLETYHLNTPNIFLGRKMLKLPRHEPISARKYRPLQNKEKDSDIRFFNIYMTTLGLNGYNHIESPYRALLV